MNKILLQNPDTKEVRETRDVSTPRGLINDGWRIVPKPLVVRGGQGK